MKLQVTIIVLLCSACFRGEEEITQVKSGAGADEVRTWYKTPTQIENTVEKSWGMNISDGKHEYITKLGPLYGGTDKLLMKATLERPTSGYVLALDLVSAWLSRLLIDKEASENSNNSRSFLFSGGIDTEENPDHGCAEDACYRDDNQQWCDCDDGITLGMYYKKGNQAYKKAAETDDTDKDTELTEFSYEERKRLMHNIQDIGDFLNMAIDEKLPIPDKGMHAAQYLLDEVFIPNLGPREGVPRPQCSDCDTGGNSKDPLASDHQAWVKVVYTLMLSGPFYINLQMVEKEN